MQNKNLFLILALLLCVSFLSAQIKVQFTDSDEYYLLETFEHKKLNYFKLADFNAIVKGQMKEILLDDRLHFYVFKKEISFCIESSFAHVASYNNKTGLLEDEYYNFYYPISYIKGEYSLPEHFLLDVFPQIFPNSVYYEDGFLLLNQRNNSSIKVIVLDPGHGGKDPGAEGANGLQEKHIVLNIAKKLKVRIEEELDVRVLLTREDDSFVSLKDRTLFANANNADLFISIHTNAAENKKAHGIEVYYLSEAKNDESRAAQALENAVVIEFEGEEALQEYSQADYVISDLIQSAQLIESINLAYKFQNNLVLETEASDRGVKSANFFVLRGAFMPSILVELGFISNFEEGKKLNKENYQDNLVESMFYGIKSFKLHYDRNNSLE
ncbi:N-acetylmuramoyl-L-alanine amidase [bacterium]|nr:N-acetylmuramoyl-L-alanine amidase [bacterium]